MNTPTDLLYAKTHEWLRQGKEGGTVGITDYAQSALEWGDFWGEILTVQGQASFQSKAISCAEAAGLFDISHMGQIRAQGAGALAALEVLLTNDPAKLRKGEGHYTFLTNDQGGVIDDLLLYRLGPEDFLLVVNASRHQEDLRHQPCLTY